MQDHVHSNHMIIWKPVVFYRNFSPNDNIRRAVCLQQNRTTAATIIWPISTAATAAVRKETLKTANWMKRFLLLWCYILKQTAIKLIIFHNSNNKSVISFLLKKIKTTLTTSGNIWEALNGHHSLFSHSSANIFSSDHP